MSMCMKGINSSSILFPGKGVEIGSNVAVKSKDLSGNVLSKTAEVGSNIVGVIPLPNKLKGKDKKEWPTSDFHSNML